MKRQPETPSAAVRKPGLLRALVGTVMALGILVVCAGVFLVIQDVTGVLTPRYSAPTMAAFCFLNRAQINCP